MRIRTLIVTVAAAFMAFAGTASAAVVEHPSQPAPAWFTEDFKQRVDASGRQGVPLPLDEPGALDICPGIVIHEGGVGTGTCLVFPAGCTANFVYYNGGGSTAPAVANGNLYLGTAGHCVEKSNEPVYGAVATPGIGATIQRIGTVSRFVEKYDDDGVVKDFAAIQIDNGLTVHPDSPVGGPQGIYDGCAPGQPLKYFGHGYEVAVAQGKPGGGVAAHWYETGFGYFGTALGGDSGSGIIHLDNRAVGDLTAITVLDPSLAFVPGEVVGSRVTWILSFLGAGYSLVNADRTLSRDTTACSSGAAGSGAGGVLRAALR